MKRSLTLLFALAALAVAFAGGAHASPPQWQTLFSGQYLTDWTFGPDNSWVVEHGAITLRREFDGKEHNADYLWTKETYGDFTLELEFKVPEQANSGIFLRTADRKDPVYTGIEVQVARRQGYIGLQDHGRAVWYRNIRVARLD